ncbi:MAG: histidine kinase, partial [Deltaproteobacteria bacterium]
FKLDSSPGRGTVVKATFQLGHVDLPPMGDLGGTVIAFLAGHPDISFRYVHRINGDEFLLDTDELKENLEVEELTDPIIMKFLREKIGDVLSSNSVV